MDSNGITDLSGLHWNPINNRLYCVQGDGHLRVLQLNSANNTFSQIANKTLSGGPEGITQVDFSANTFYIIDENNYEIKKYNHTASFSTVTLSKHWNLLASPSPMQDTGNTGPEGIVFVPDSFIASSGFVSSVTGQPYTSVNGMGGLMFIANQDEGYVWVFDVNPNVNDDFIYVGKYKTNRTESCDLAFDRSTGMLYILHNIAGSNKLEVTDLSVPVIAGERKFTTVNEYHITTPDANDDIEGFALTPKCPAGNSQVWLCRDAESNEDLSVRQDVLRWFSPFASDGSCSLGLETFSEGQSINVYPNPAKSLLTISLGDSIGKDYRIRLVNELGQLVFEKGFVENNFSINVSAFLHGVYIIEIRNAENSFKTKFVKD